MPQFPGRALNLTRSILLAERLAVAHTYFARMRGLIGRSSLPRGEGLWFPGESSIHMMFMAFPIDAVFLAAPDVEGLCRVVALRPDLPAWWGLAFARGARGVLELPAGTITASGTQLGDLIRLEIS